MEKITDKIAALPDGQNYFSLEFFPPKTAMVCAPQRGTGRPSISIAN
jgi:methylenetetrahydrofolate reductase (NADPH)